MRFSCCSPSALLLRHARLSRMFSHYNNAPGISPFAVLFSSSGAGRFPIRPDPPAVGIAFASINFRRGEYRRVLVTLPLLSGIAISHGKRNPASGFSPRGAPFKYTCTRLIDDDPHRGDIKFAVGRSCHGLSFFQGLQTPPWVHHHRFNPVGNHQTPGNRFRSLSVPGFAAILRNASDNVRRVSSINRRTCNVLMRLTLGLPADNMKLRGADTLYEVLHRL